MRASGTAARDITPRAGFSAIADQIDYWVRRHAMPLRLPLYGRAGLAKRRSVISITDAGEMPVYSHSQEKQCWTGIGRMLFRFWRWLEYDPVALAVLLIGVGSIAVLVLGI
jgi:hypothetical protein